ncbi:hypothetical protein D3C80_1527080 [compost metagenome]
MVGGVDLHRRANLAIVADVHRQHIEDHAVEVHERIAANVDVVAIVAIERRADHRAFAGLAKVLGQQAVTCVVEQFEAVVVAMHPVLVGNLLGLQLGAASVVELAAEHFLFFAEGHGNSFRGLCSVRESVDDRTTVSVRMHKESR